MKVCLKKTRGVSVKSNVSISGFVSCEIGDFTIVYQFSGDFAKSFCQI